MRDIQLLVSGQVVDLPYRSYPDSWPWIERSTNEAISAILLRPRSVDAFLAALFFVDALAERGMSVPPLVLPCIPGARQDRLNDTGDYLFTAKSIAREINLRNFPRVIVCDPHSDVSVALIDRCEVHRLPVDVPGKYDGVISPDGGAEKRAYLMASLMGVPLFHAWKHRETSTGKISDFGVEPLPAGHYLVADDLCDGGGTFVGLANVAKQHHGVRASLYVTHGLFTRGPAPLLKSFDSVYCTDSTLGNKSGVTVLECCETLLRKFT